MAFEPGRHQENYIAMRKSVDFATLRIDRYIKDKYAVCYQREISALYSARLFRDGAKYYTRQVITKELPVFDSDLCVDYVYDHFIPDIEKIFNGFGMIICPSKSFYCWDVFFTGEEVAKIQFTVDCYVIDIKASTEKEESLYGV